MKNKKIIIFAGILIFGAILVVIFLLTNKKTEEILTPIANQPSIANFQPEFISLEEKQQKNLLPEDKIQAVKRGANGELMIYKIIKTDQDIYYPSKQLE